MADFFTGKLDKLLVEVDLHLFVAYGLFELCNALLELPEFLRLRVFIYHEYSSFLVVG